MLNLLFFAPLFNRRPELDIQVGTNHSRPYPLRVAVVLEIQFLMRKYLLKFIPV